MSHIDTGVVLELVGHVKARLAKRAVADDEIGREAATLMLLLQQLPPLSGMFSPSTHPATRHLDAAFQAGTELTSTLIAAIRPVAFHLPWRYSYAERADAPTLKDNVAFAEIIGPDAPFRSERVCLGLTLIAPDTYYPPHWHPAIELYFVVAGEAVWVANGIANPQSPGSFVLHPSRIIHAMQTNTFPLLAVYTWSGKDIVSSSKYV